MIHTLHTKFSWIFKSICSLINIWIYHCVMSSNVHIFQKIEAICDICNIFIVNIYNFILVKNKNMLRTFWASKGLLNKNVEPQIKFRRSYKTKKVYLYENMTPKRSKEQEAPTNPMPLKTHGTPRTPAPTKACFGRVKAFLG